uniref:Uncharacterized protein n=1 Tax=Ditylenchus dipsaci TaxID=166011 RepID=A0A915ESX1_9BILA
MLKEATPVFYYIKLLLLSIVFWPNASGDVFTAMVDLENLLASEASTTSNVIQQYIQSEEQRLEQLKEFANNYRRNTNTPKP